MISLLSMAVHVLGTVFVYILKAFFSMFSWFINAMFRAVRLLFVVLPCTSMILMALLGAAIFSLISGNTTRFPASTAMYSDLKTWWNSEVYSLKGSTGYIFLLLLTVLMFIPVVTVILCISVIISHGNILFTGIVFDAAIYLVRAIFGKGFVAQAMGRYYRLFPEAGKRHTERYHDKLLQKRNRELEKELEESRRLKKGRKFYGDPEEDFYENFDDGYEKNFDRTYRYPDPIKVYDDRYYEDDDDYEDEYDGRYIEDDEYNDEEYSDEEYGDAEYGDEEYGDEFYEDEEFDDMNASSGISSANTGSFDFFAGCNSKESADRKYKSLVKLYHPDNMDGDTAALQEINAQYAEVKKKFG